jgi:hypothetical protein
MLSSLWFAGNAAARLRGQQQPVAADGEGVAADGEGVAADQAWIVLRNHCHRCHNRRDQLGGLDLTSRPSMLRGGDSGPVVSLDDPPRSLLLARLREGSMPPINDGDAVPPPDIQRLQNWIASGLDWPVAARSKPAVEPACPDTAVRHPQRRGWLRRFWVRLRSAR